MGAEDADFALTFEHERGEGKQNARDSHDHGDGSQHGSHGKGLVENLEHAASKVGICINRKLPLASERLPEILGQQGGLRRISQRDRERVQAVVAPITRKIRALDHHKSAVACEIADHAHHLEAGGAFGRRKFQNLAELGPVTIRETF